MISQDDDTPPDWETIENCRILFGSIIGIRKQALDDIVETIKQNREIDSVLAIFDLVICQTIDKLLSMVQ